MPIYKYYQCLRRITREGEADRIIQFSAFDTEEQAIVAVARSHQQAIDSNVPAVDYYEYREIDHHFVMPSRPTPRELFQAEVEPSTDGWPHNKVRIKNGDDVVVSYDRNYAFYHTFEPFRQNDHFYALISRDYTATAVMDLETGAVIAEEEPSTFGFCPVGFYVPDWWDIHDGSVKPGMEHWDENDEWPVGDFGLVFGCVWADDSSWKVEYLDLSRITEGVITRQARFGYLPVWPLEKGQTWADRVEIYADSRQICFPVQTIFDLEKGTRFPND